VDERPQPLAAEQRSGLSGSGNGKKGKRHGDGDRAGNGGNRKCSSHCATLFVPASRRAA
jgi:hypothetical protein